MFVSLSIIMSMAVRLLSMTRALAVLKLSEKDYKATNVK